MVDVVRCQKIVNENVKKGWPTVGVIGMVEVSRPLFCVAMKPFALYAQNCWQMGVVPAYSERPLTTP